VANTSPSPERSRHGPLLPPEISDAHFRQYWRAQDRVEKLHLAGLITAAELRAAIAFRTLYHRAHGGDLRTQQWDFIKIDRNCRRPAALPGMDDRRIAALRRLEAIATALGALYRVVELVVIDELSWSEARRRLSLGDCRTCKKWAAAALAALAAM